MHRPGGARPRLLEGPVTAYVGYDATADSLHVGSLISIMMLRLFQQTGHRPIVLMGGGTTKVGDPAGKDEHAPAALRRARSRRNIASIRRVFAKFLTSATAPTDAVMVDNADWLDELSYMVPARHRPAFLGQPHAAFDSVKPRLEREQPLTFLEFNYMLLQAYDFLELDRRDGCLLQMGGSDQWGNIVNGRRARPPRRTTRELFGLTTPLLTTASGAKMGKTAAGAVWLNADRAQPLRLLAVLAQHRGRRRRPLPASSSPSCRSTRSRGWRRSPGAEINEAKKVLANAATTLLHGAEAAEAAAETARRVVRGGRARRRPADRRGAAAELARGVAVIDALRRRRPRRQPRRGAPADPQGGVRVNDAPVKDELHKLGESDLRDGVIKLSVGRKRHALVRAA